MKALILLSLFLLSARGHTQGLPLTDDNHSLTPDTLNPPIQTPVYSWERQSDGGYTKGWQSTAPVAPSGGGVGGGGPSGFSGRINDRDLDLSDLE